MGGNIKQKIGISSFTYTWAIGIGPRRPRLPLTAQTLLEKAQSIGVKVLQIADNLPLHMLPDSEIESLAAISKKRGITLEVGTRGLQPALIDAYLSIAQRLNSRILRILIDDKTYQPGIKRVVAILKDYASCFREKNIVLAIENHDRFNAREYARIIEKAGSDRIGICLDTANSIGTYESLENIVHILGPYTVNVHLKDYTIERLPHRLGFIVQGAPLGKGMLPVEWFLEKMRTFNRAETVILELWTPPEKTITETVAKEERWARASVRYLRKATGENRA